MRGFATLVLGASGKTGRRVAERLAARGGKVRAAGRSAVPRFDWDDPATWPAALFGTDAVYVVHPELALPGAAEAIRSFAALALSTGARRLVLLSRRGEEGSAMAEQALRESGADWTIVRASWLSQDFSEGRQQAAVARGLVALPARQVGEPFVDAGDVADVAVEALTGDGHRGRVYELTGPRLLTFAEAVEEIGEAVGREIRYVRVPMDEYAARLASEKRLDGRQRRCCATCSPRCSTAATPASRTASGARSGASRATSPTTRAKRRPPASGTAGGWRDDGRATRSRTPGSWPGAASTCSRSATTRRASGRPSGSASHAPAGAASTRARAAARSRAGWRRRARAWSPPTST